MLCQRSTTYILDAYTEIKEKGCQADHCISLTALDLVGAKLLLWFLGIMDVVGCLWETHSLKDMA